MQITFKCLTIQIINRDFNNIKISNINILTIININSSKILNKTQNMKKKKLFSIILKNLKLHKK